MRSWFQWFALEYDKYDGPLVNASMAVDYHAFDNFGVGVGAGLGYSYFNYDLTVDNDKKLTFNYEFHGPMLYANIYFLQSV